jgi:hypothetical protein
MEYTIEGTLEKEADKKLDIDLKEFEGFEAIEAGRDSCLDCEGNWMSLFCHTKNKKVK